eukprot:gnl/Chilomastix_caulleri/3989.p3 GENE.gnl/Chilomastix_caulleri/3989~~gnl/Chilomastix_caulleri/3989.p3  ORF type:complete len:50 (-),score=1.09 gnl/Chilomastix_caulleri/3989:134-283(-)
MKRRQSRQIWSSESGAEHIGQKYFLHSGHLVPQLLQTFPPQFSQVFSIL